MKKFLSLLLPALLISGCASLGSSGDTAIDAIVIDKVDSNFARIGNITLWPSEDGIMVRGEVIRKLAGRGPIYGHVHIEALDAGEHTLLTLESNYLRPNTKSKLGMVIAELPINPSKAKTVRITHHADREH